MVGRKDTSKVTEKLQNFRFRVAEKIWYAKTEGETFAKRFKLFVVFCAVLIAASKFLYASGLTIPNMELIIPALVVVGAFGLHVGSSERWNKATKYFGLLALLTVFVVDVSLWGFRRIYLFTWPSFILIWFLAKRKDLSFMDDFSDVAVDATLTTAILILVYDVITAFGTWVLWGSLSVGSLLGVFMGQIPFTLYHMSSLLFVPPLVALGKTMTKVRVRVASPVKTATRNRSRMRR